MNPYKRYSYVLLVILSCISCGSLVGPVERRRGPAGLLVLESRDSEGQTQVVSKDSLRFQDARIETEFVSGSYQWDAGEVSFLIVAKVEGFSLTTDSSVVDVLGAPHRNRMTTGNEDRRPVAATNHEVLAVRQDSKSESRICKLDGFQRLDKNTDQSFLVGGFLGQMGQRQFVDGNDEEKDRELPTIVNQAERSTLETNEKYLLTALFDRGHTTRFRLILKIVDDHGQVIEREFIVRKN